MIKSLNKTTIKKNSHQMGNNPRIFNSIDCSYIRQKCKCYFKKDQWDWYYLGRHNEFCSVGLTVLIPQKLRVYAQFNASYT